MAKFSGADCGFFITGGYSLLGTITQFTDKISAVVEDSHSLGTSWVEKAFTGVRAFEISQSGYYTSDVGANHDALLGAGQGLATSKVLTYAVEPNTAGNNFVGAAGALAVDYTRSPVRGALTKAAANYQGNGIVEHGKILLPLSSKTTTGNSTAAGVDFGASNTSGGSAYLQITAFTSGPSTAVQVDVMHSVDNLTYTSWQGFTSATAGPLGQRINSTAKLERYAAVRWQGASNGASFPTNVTMFVGLART